MCTRGISAGAGKCCIRETESCNLVNTFRCKFTKGDENKVLVYGLSRLKLCVMGELQFGTYDYKNYIGHPPVGMHPHPLYAYDFAHLCSLNKCQVYLSCASGGAYWKVQCRARWRGLGKLWNIHVDAIWGFFPVKFRYKLCILNFIVVLLSGKLFIPLFRQLKTFLASSILPSRASPDSSPPHVFLNMYTSFSSMCTSWFSLRRPWW